MINIENIQQNQHYLRNYNGFPDDNSNTWLLKSIDKEYKQINIYFILRKKIINKITELQAVAGIGTEKYNNNKQITLIKCNNNRLVSVNVIIKELVKLLEYCKTERYLCEKMRDQLLYVAFNRNILTLNKEKILEFHDTPKIKHKTHEITDKPIIHTKPIKFTFI